MMNTILLIHHRPRTLRRARALLEASGYQVEVARDRRAGIDAFLRIRPDLVLVDAELPGTRAGRVCKELKRTSHGENAPILLMTASPETARGEASVDGFVTTPLVDEELLATVRRFLPDRSEEEEDDSSLPSAEGDATTRPAKNVTGDLEHLNIAEIVQTLNLGTKTARVTISCGDREGRIWFRNGAARHASTGELKGERAFYEMMSWGSGEFVIEYGVSNGKHSINHDTMYLVMEGLRQIDEREEAETEPLAEEHDVDRRAPTAVAEPEEGEPSSTASETPPSDPYATVLLTPEMRKELAEVIAAVTRPPEEKALPEAAEPPPADADAAEKSDSTSTASDPGGAAGPSRSWLWAALAACLTLLAIGGYLLTDGLLSSDPVAASKTTTDPDVAVLGALEPDATPAVNGVEAPPPENPVDPADGPAVGLGSIATVATIPEETAPTETVATGNVQEDGVEADEESAEPATVASDGSGPSERAEEEAFEPQLDLSASIVAADEVLAQMADPGPAPEPAIEPAYLQLTGTSSVKDGRLTLLVDGNEVFSRELSAEKRGLKRTRETFETRVDIEAGKHKLVARLELASESYGYENAIEVELEPGEGRTLAVVAGKSRKRPILLTLQ
jgi:DNA-binding response OmpR family regulator